MPRPQAINTIRSGTLMGFYPLCKRLQINPVKLLQEERLPSTALRSPDLMISYDRFAHLLNRAADAAEYPLFGLAMSSYQGLKTFGTLGLIAGGYDTVEQCLGAIQKYFRFHAQGVAIEISVEGKETRIVLDFDLDPDIGLEQLAESSLGLGYNILREMAPMGLTGASIHFAHDALAPVETYRRHTDARLLFGQADNAIVFPTSILSRRPAPPSDEIRTYLESFLQDEAKGQEQPILHTVSKLINELIPAGEATLTTIAPLMNMHVRTLQRELSEAGTDFRTLLDEVRFEIARSALQLGQSVTDLALNLGYSEISAFSRAFKRWSGVSPQQWRQPFGGH